MFLTRDHYISSIISKTASTWWATLLAQTDWDSVYKPLIKTFSSPIDSEFPELSLHNHTYDPLMESLCSYYFNKIGLQLCRKFDPALTYLMIKAHILKD